MKRTRAVVILLFAAITFAVCEAQAREAPVLSTGESAGSLTDLADLTAVETGSVSVPQAASGTMPAPRTALLPGEVEIAPYGEPEDKGAFRNTGFKAVRFDPPLDPPYRIKSVKFPSFTTNGVPAVFQSVRLCEADPTTGVPRIADPLYIASPYAASPDGNNEILLDLEVLRTGATFYWCVEFPAIGAEFPDGFPFLRMDYTFMERGFYASSYDIALDGRTTVDGERNLVASLVCSSSIALQALPQPVRNLGANRRATAMEFSFDTPLDDSPAQTVDLLWRRILGPWHVLASRGSGAGVIREDSIPAGVVIWGAQTVVNGGQRATLSNATVTTSYSVVSPLFGYDFDEPNGDLNEACEISLPTSMRSETYFPAGDRDFFTFTVTPGVTIEASAAATATDGANDLDLVIMLYDRSGRIVASDDNSLGGHNPRVTYRVPDVGGKRIRYKMEVTDVRGSVFAPDAPPRHLEPVEYLLSLRGLPAERSHAAAQGLPDGSTGSLSPPLELRMLQAVYPTPTRGQLFVRARGPAGGAAIVELFSITGRRMFSARFDALNPDAQTLSMNVSGLASGVYFLRYRNPASTVVRTWPRGLVLVK